MARFRILQLFEENIIFVVFSIITTEDNVKTLIVVLDLTYLRSCPDITISTLSQTYIGLIATVIPVGLCSHIPGLDLHSSVAQLELRPGLEGTPFQTVL